MYENDKASHLNKEYALICKYMNVLWNYNLKSLKRGQCYLSSGKNEDSAEKSLDRISS